METHRIESRCYRTGKYTVCRRVRASFIPEVLRAGAVKGLITAVLSVKATLALLTGGGGGGGGLWLAHHLTSLVGLLGAHACAVRVGLRGLHAQW